MTPRRSLQTILVTDLVGSTQRASEMGDRSWSMLLDRHHIIVRKTLRRWGAREVNQTGDGFLAVLDSPARGIACAAEIRDAIHPLGLDVRCGLHMAEIEHAADGSVGGIGVHIGARVAAHAKAGEILVSQAIRDAEEGSGFGFEDRGPFTLKGVTGEWRLFRVTVITEHASSMIPQRGERIAAALQSRRGSVIVAAAGLVALLAAVTLRGRISDETAPDTDRSVVSQGQITFLGNVRKGSVSPDGKSMAYVADNLPTEDDRLFVQDLAGGDPIEIYREQHLYYVRWSPTGEELLVGASNDVEGRGRIVRLPRLGGPGEEFPMARWFAWSPDARAFAFGYYTPRFLFVRDLSSALIDSIALPGGYDVLLDLDWSPTGDRLAFILHKEPSLYEAWLIDRSGSGARRVVQDTVPLFNPRWSRDGQAIYYTRQASSSTHLMRVESSSSLEETALRPMAIANLGRAFSFELFGEDHSASYISAAHGHSNLSLITVQDSEISTITQLTSETAQNATPALSPDGQRVAFTRTAGDRQNIHVLDVDTGSSRQITFLEGHTCCPAWSPDGLEIAFFSSRGGESRVWKIPSDGGSPVPLGSVHMDSPETLQWAPSSRILVQSSWNVGTIILIDPQTGDQRPFVPNRMLWSPRLSPEGVRIAGSSGKGIVIVSLRDGSHKILETSTPIMILGWSSDGEGIYGFSPDSAAVLRYSTLTLEPDWTLKVDCEFVESVSSDGTRFICTSYETLLDMWIARNLPSSAGTSAGEHD